MHWENPPKTTHNEDAIRDSEREESKRIANYLKQAAWIAIPVSLLILWWLWH